MENISPVLKLLTFKVKVGKIFRKRRMGADNEFRMRKRIKNTCKTGRSGESRICVQNESEKVKVKK